MKQTDLQLTGGAGKTARRELDFYPTPANVTHALMKFLHSEVDFIFDEIPLYIHEPACGNGAMSEVIKQYGHAVFSSDINTEYGETQNFLTEMNWERFDAIITNPPFDLSQNFIEVAIRRSRIVCMLLKSQYWHAKGRYELYTSNPPAYICPLTWRPDFYEHLRKPGDKASAPTMEVAWTIWIKGNHSRKYIPLLK